MSLFASTSASLTRSRSPGRVPPPTRLGAGEGDSTMRDELEPPIIILGNTRSGTSVLQQVLGSHPSVVPWYEPRHLWQVADPGRAHDEFDAEDATERVRRYVRRRFLALQRRNGGSRVVEKTPVNVLRIPYVRAILPEAVYLYVVRSPWSFISSVEQKWQRPVSSRGVVRRLRSTPVRHLHHYAAKYVRQQVDKRVLHRRYLSIWGPRYRGIQTDLANEDLLTVIARQWAVPSAKAAGELGTWAAGDVLELRYEDFVLEPVGWLERICAHTGVELTPELVAMARTHVDPNRREKWRRLAPEQLAALLPELDGEMRRHGYAVPEEIAAARAGGLLPTHTRDMASHDRPDRSRA